MLKFLGGQKTDPNGDGQFTRRKSWMNSTPRGIFHFRNLFGSMGVRENAEKTRKRISHFVAEQKTGSGECGSAITLAFSCGIQTEFHSRQLFNFSLKLSGGYGYSFVSNHR